MMNRAYWPVVLAVLLMPRVSSAQTPSSLIPDLILKGITLPGADAPGSPHAGHFTLGDPTFGGSQAGSRSDVEAIQAVANFNDSLRSQLTNFPLGSSTGGFTYTFNEASGTYARSTASFGPAFTERAATIGKRKLSIGYNFQHTDFDTFGGQNLKDRSITFYLPHTDCCPVRTDPAAPGTPDTPGFEGDIMEAAVQIKATTNTSALFANYGLTNHFDVGIAVPIVSVDLEANVRATIIRLSTAATPGVHTFVAGQDVTQQVFPASGNSKVTASGIGDLLIRSKYVFSSHGGSGIGAGVDLRLPTGDKDKLLGIGTTQGKLYLVVSGGNDRVSPHFNVGYTISGSGDRTPVYGVAPVGVSDEFNYAGGVEIVAVPKLTVIGDFLGRTLLDSGKVDVQTKTYQYRSPAGADATVPLSTSATNPLTNQPYHQLGLTPNKNLNLMWGATGAKYNPVGNLLIMGNVLFPLTDAGLRDKLTFAFGFELAF
jgi:hypothetical protein